MEADQSGIKVTAEPGKQVIDIVETFNAPLELVYRAYAEPELIKQWLGPRKYEIEVDKLDLRFGGTWRFINRAEGEEYVFKGVFHEVTHTRLVRTFEWEGMPGHISLESAVFEEHDGRTTITARSIYETVEDRDGMLGGGEMEEGMLEVHDRLAELLERLQAQRAA